MPLVATRGNAGAFAYGFTAGGAPEVLGGMVLMTPTSVNTAGTGSSATIGTNGSVEFSACTSLSLNGVFTADYDNYAISLFYSNGNRMFGRLRTSGSDATGTADYNDQKLQAQSTSTFAARQTSNGYWVIGQGGGTERDALTMTIYGPYLSEETAFRTVTINASATIYDMAGTHELSSSYDGITIYPEAGTIAGSVAVYGLVGT